MNIYCFDTSALLDNPSALIELGNDGDELLLSFCVLDELDGKKEEHGKVGKHARDVLRMLDNLRADGGLVEGVMLSTGATLFVVHDEEGKNNDQRILNLAVKQADCLVSNDIAMRVKADALGLKTVGFEAPCSTKSCAPGPAAPGSPGRALGLNQYIVPSNPAAPPKIPESTAHPELRLLHS